MIKIACTYENGEIFQHFGHTKQFKIYEADSGGVKSSKIVNTEGSGHGALAGFLKNLGVNILICGGIGGGAKHALDEAKIELYAGITGDADTAVSVYLSGVLVQESDANCSHHAKESGGHHSCHDSGEVCKNHGCGEHECVHN